MLGNFPPALMQRLVQAVHTWTVQKALELTCMFFADMWFDCAGSCAARAFLNPTPRPTSGIVSESGPYGSVLAHINIGSSPMPRDHFQIPPDPKFENDPYKSQTRSNNLGWGRVGMMLPSLWSSFKIYWAVESVLQFIVVACFRVSHEGAIYFETNFRRKLW